MFHELGTSSSVTGTQQSLLDCEGCTGLYPVTVTEKKEVRARIEDRMGTVSEIT